MNAAFQEARTYLDPKAWGFFSVFCEGRQHPYPLAQLESVLDVIPQNRDVYLSQASFNRPNRRIVNLNRLGLAFVDCETYKTRYADFTPDQQANAVALHCEEMRLPRPSIINFSGRGIHVKWLFDKTLPALALPRWNAVQRYLVEAFKPFGVDRSAKDASRMLRAVGTTNSRSGMEVRTVWYDEALFDFNMFAHEVLPYTREDLQVLKKKQSEAKEGRAKKGREIQSNLWSIAELWWHRLADIRKLIELRGWQDGVPEGWRNNFLFVAACAVSWGANPQNIQAEINELARQFMPSLLPSAIHSSTASVIAKAQTGTPYKFKNQTLIDLLGIEPDEQKHLKTLIDDDERNERRRIYDSQRKWGKVERAAYLANPKERREKALALRTEGLTYAAIGKILECSPDAVDKLLRTARRG